MAHVPPPPPRKSQGKKRFPTNSTEFSSPPLLTLATDNASAYSSTSKLSLLGDEHECNSVSLAIKFQASPQKTGMGRAANVNIKMCETPLVHINKTREQELKMAFVDGARYPHGNDTVKPVFPIIQCSFPTPLLELWGQTMPLLHRTFYFNTPLHAPRLFAWEFCVVALPFPHSPHNTVLGKGR